MRLKQGLPLYCMTDERNWIIMVDMICIRKIVGTLLFLGNFDIFFSRRVLVKPASYISATRCCLSCQHVVVVVDLMVCVDPQRTRAAKRTQG